MAKAKSAGITVDVDHGQKNRPFIVDVTNAQTYEEMCAMIAAGARKAGWDD